MNIISYWLTLFTIRISIIPDPSFGVVGTVVPVHVPIGTQMQTGAAGDGAEIDGIGIIAAIGLYIGNGGGNNGNLLRETKMESEY